MNLTRRGFIKLTGAGLAASSLGALGFGYTGEALAAAVRPFKLAATTETRNTCTYCSVACGILILQYGRPREERPLQHHPHRGRSGPSRQSRDAVPERFRSARHRPRADPAQDSTIPGAGSNEFKEVSWDFALDRIARLMKDDRDKNFVAKDEAGTTVNRWTSTGMLAASASSTETAYATWKVVRSLGMVVFDNQARV